MATSTSLEGLDLSDFRTLFKYSPHACVVLTPDTYSIVAASESYLQLTGAEERAVIGRSIFDTLDANRHVFASFLLQNLQRSLDLAVKKRREVATDIQKF